ncbi:RNA polymerase sigma factor [Membranihabitans marinus]|uniref:RNA polymerase sigma factor n=1 Tax=Membranihabitans marinus TaxID=1227546 RepID=UPI001F1C0634|nr:sigma-70 family RNA polymerase sigma factor [Membranihabitans marinus]
MSKEQTIDLLKKLYFDNYEVMLRYGVKLVGDASMVKDIIQRLFLQFYEKSLSLERHPNPDAYVIKSFRRELLRAQKSYFLSADRVIGEDETLVYSAEDWVIEDEEKSQKKQNVADLLNSLSSRQREIIYLHYFEGKTYKEIAHVLDIEYQSVLNNLQRGFRKIREVYPEGI